MVGALLGDGALSQYRQGVLGFISADIEILQRLSCVLEKRDMCLVKVESREYHYAIRTVTRERKGRGKKTWLRTIIEKYALGTIAQDKALPVSMLYWPEQYIAAMLTGLIDTDGCVTRRGEIVFSTTSLRLARQYKFLLWRMGYHVRVPNKPAGTDDYCYSLRLSPDQSYQMGLRLPRLLTRKSALLRDTVGHRVSNYGKLPQSVTRLLKQELHKVGVLYKDAEDQLCGAGIPGSFLRYPSRQGSVRALHFLVKHFGLTSSDLTASIDVVWTQITGIEPVGTLLVADAEVADTHNFLLSDYVVHNSEGLDIPRLDTLVMASPVTDIEQAVGRIRRAHDTKREPVVVDIVDSEITEAIRWFRAREYAYRRKIKVVTFKLS